MKARYLDEEHTMFELTEDSGKIWCGPVDMQNRHYRKLIQNNIPIAEYEPEE